MTYAPPVRETDSRMSIAHTQTVESMLVDATALARSTNTHVLITGCRGDCDYDPDFVAQTDGIENPEIGLCTCGIWLREYRLICPHENGAQPITAGCASHDTCGCMPTTYGPRTADGELSLIVIGTGEHAIEIDEDDFADYWADDIQPVCPATELPHVCWESTLYVPTNECFGRLCAESNDEESFEPLALDGPGFCQVTWTAEDGMAFWERVSGAEPHYAASTPAGRKPVSA